MANIMSLRVEVGLDNDTLTHHSSALMQEQHDLLADFSDDSHMEQWQTVQPFPGIPSLFTKLLYFEEYMSLSEGHIEPVETSIAPSVPATPTELVACNCTDKGSSTLKAGTTCPHMLDSAHIAFLTSIKARLKHLEFVQKKSSESKEDVFADDIPTIQAHLRKYAHNILSETDCGRSDCHVKAYIASLFVDLVPSVEEVVEDLHHSIHLRKCDLGKLCVNLSFSSNILLCVLKIFAYSFSLSMSVLASMVDSCLDILSGLVLYICARLARSGANKMDPINAAALNRQSITYPIGKRRYETLGVLSFACIMGTFAVTLIYESIKQTVALAKHAPEDPPKFDTLQIAIIAFTIILKLFLCFLCHFVGRRSKTLSEACTAYRDDHRNDVLSNSVGFITAFVGARFNGKDGTLNLSYIDPVGSIILCLYILVNWALSAREQMRSMVGRALDMESQARLVLHAMHFDPSIERVNNVLAYQCGRESTVEVTICLPNKMLVCNCHDIVHALQDHIHELDFVERCFVHVESVTCYSPILLGV